MKLFLSSAESPDNSKTLLSVPRKKCVLVTFFYYYKKKDSKIRPLLELYKTAGYEVMLDSGAHTFLNYIASNVSSNSSYTRHSIGGGKKNLGVECGEYFKSYLEFLKEYKEYFDFIVELDIDILVGYEVILKWRKLLAEVVGAKKLVAVYHETIPDWQTEIKVWCEKGYLLGIGGKPDSETLNYLFTAAKKYGGRTHGFAKTSNKLMSSYPWFSVDSSTWNTGKRFGILFYLEKDKFPYLIQGLTLKGVRNGNKDDIKVFRERVLKSASKYIDFSLKDLLFAKEKSALIDVLNINAFLDYEEFITKYWSKK